jgi:hypothetical protein
MQLLKYALYNNNDILKDYIRYLCDYGYVPQSHILSWFAGHGLWREMR